MSSQTLLELSHAQMGRGVALRQTTTLTQLATTIPIGTSPAEGTGCTLYLNTQNDPAYDNATVTFIVQIEGKQVVYNTQTIAPSDNAAYQALEYTTSGCASDVWQVQFTLNNGTLPANPLQSAIISFGVENLPTGGGGGGVTAVTGVFPILSSGGATPAISIDPSAIPWVQVGGTGGIIEPVDPTASVQASGGSATGQYSFAAAGNGVASGAYATALGSNAFAFGIGSLAVSGGEAIQEYDVAFGNISIANGGTSFAHTGGTTGGYASFAGVGGVAQLDQDIALGPSSMANGGGALALWGGQALGADCVAIGPGANLNIPGSFGVVTGGFASLLLGADGANETWVAQATDMYFFNSTLGFFGVTPVAQPFGGPATAGNVYTPTEQAMLNAVYDCLQGFGLLG